MTDLAMLSLFVGFIALGLTSPFVWSLGYVWIDTMLPHRLSYSMLATLPVALIMGAGAFLSYLIQDRRSPPKLTKVHVLCIVLAIWITLTTTWAVAPVQAWAKWDPSFKTILFAIFIPFIFRTRVQIEAFVLVLLFSTAAHLIPWGVKTLFSGGGYEISLGLLPVNSATLGESSSVAAIAVMFIPILFWVRIHSLLLPWKPIRTVMAFGLTLVFLVANIGTFARTGLVGLALLGGGMFLRTKRKISFILIAAVLGSAMLFVTSDKWTSRMETVGSYQTENSAYTRILVWKWTWDFAMTHPLGGGFNSYVTNVLVEPGPDGKPVVQFGRAFHNIWFAALGEHGYPGLAMYIGIFVLNLLGMRRLIKRCRGREDLEWAADLARASQLAYVIIMICGSFVDISFNPFIWNMVALMMCLNAHVERVLGPVARAVAGAPALRPSLPSRLAPGEQVAVSRYT